MVSIIVTAYNYGHYLSDTLSSVLDQTFPDWECIVVDGGSTDDTGNVVNHWVKKDPRFRYEYRENKGVSAARNAGLELSKGDYIQFLDGDDLLQKNKLAEQVHAFEEIPQADIIYTDVRFFDDGNPDALRSSLTGNKPDDWMPRLSGKGETILKDLCKINFLVTHAPLIKRSVIDRAGQFDESMAALEDWDFWLRCAFAGCYFHFHSAGEDLVLVRVHKNSLSKRKDLMLEGNFTLLQRRLQDKNTGLRYYFYFLMKYTVLFWDTFFSSADLPKLPVHLFLFSILFFPAWMLVKFIRLIKRTG